MLSGLFLIYSLRAFWFLTIASSVIFSKYLVSPSSAVFKLYLTSPFSFSHCSSASETRWLYSSSFENNLWFLPGYTNIFTGFSLIYSLSLSSASENRYSNSSFENNCFLLSVSNSINSGSSRIFSLILSLASSVSFSSISLATVNICSYSSSENNPLYFSGFTSMNFGNLLKNLLKTSSLPSDNQAPVNAYHITASASSYDLKAFSFSSFVIGNFSSPKFIWPCSLSNPISYLSSST